MAAYAFTDTVDSVLRLLPRFARPPRPGEPQPLAGEGPAFCPDAAPAGLDVAGLRESARRLGVLPPDGLGWFGRLVRERLRRSLSGRPSRDWESLYPGLDADERAARHVAHVARRAALSGGLSAAGAHVGEAVTILTEGLAAPICVPAVVASIAGTLVASAKAQIDLVFDLGSIHGVAFDVNDTAELAAIFDLALSPGRATACAPAGHAARPPGGDEMFARLGRSLLEDATLGLLPFVGIPYSAVGNYRAMMSVGAAACGSIRRRLALRDAIAGLASGASSALLLEGAWLLATVDGVATHEELLIVAALARALPDEERSRALRLDALDERAFLERLAAERAALVGALVVVAGLRGPTRHPERRFLARVGDAAGIAVDLARVDAIHRALDAGPCPAAN
jgi:hypothetical protein